MIEAALGNVRAMFVLVRVALILFLVSLAVYVWAEDLTPIAVPDDYIQVYPISAYRVIDGDTVEVRLEYGQGISHVVGLRIAGADTPETNRKAQKEAGDAVEAVVVQWIADQTHLLAHYSKVDKFGGRIDGDLVAPGADSGLAAYLLENGLARPYEGGTRGEWTEEQLSAITAAARALIREPSENP